MIKSGINYVVEEGGISFFIHNPMSALAAYWFEAFIPFGKIIEEENDFSEKWSGQWRDCVCQNDREELMFRFIDHYVALDDRHLCYAEDKFNYDQISNDENAEYPDDPFVWMIDVARNKVVEQCFDIIASEEDAG